MKKLFAMAGMISAAATLTVSQPARAVEIQAADIAVAISQNIQIQVNALDLINWKVGDTANYNVSLGSFGNGSMVESATSEEGRAIWIKQAISIMGQNEVMEMLINRADGKVLKMKHNGQDMQIPNDKIEIISQDVTQVTVPAGTFDCVHVVAKSQQVSKMEIWANPQATVLEGALKQVMATQFGVDITMELTSFKRVQ